jgi:hypothetical protein
VTNTAEDDPGVAGVDEAVEPDHGGVGPADDDPGGVPRSPAAVAGLGTDTKKEIAFDQRTWWVREVGPVLDGCMRDPVYRRVRL